MHKLFFYLFAVCSLCSVVSQVLELDDKFEENRKDQAFLVKFYAPWCGHCRHLESTYHQVSLELRNSPITVARLDATRFSSVASYYSIQGYPTIKFIHKNKVVTYNGERTQKSIVDFAKKIYGPAVNEIKSKEEFDIIKNKLHNDVFFLYLHDNQNEKLQSLYGLLADKLIINSHFFSSLPQFLPQELIGKIPNLFVFKDGEFEQIENIEEMENWIERKRWGLVERVGGIGLNKLSSLQKLLLIYVHNQPNHYYDIMKTLAKEKNHIVEKYQFVWLNEIDTANNIMMSNYEAPFFLILNTSDHYYFLPEKEIETKSELLKFLNDVLIEKSKPLGGRGLVQRFKRLFYDLWGLIKAIYNESIWLALIVFGVPSLVISIICYTICCMESSDDLVFEEDDEILEENDFVPQRADMKKIQ